MRPANCIAPQSIVVGRKRGDTSFHPHIVMPGALRVSRYLRRVPYVLLGLRRERPRKLLVALWRYLETGVVPRGAVLKG